MAVLGRGSEWTLADGGVVEVRDAHPADAGAVARLYDAVAAEHEGALLYRPGAATTGDWRRLLADLRAAPRVLSLLAVTPEAPARWWRGASHAVAHLVLAPEAEPAAAHVARLGLVVAAGWRRRGLGGRLLEAGVDWAGANGFVRVTLGVLGGNDAARRFYLAHGFVEEGRRRGQYRTPRGYDDEVLMARTVDPTLPPARWTSAVS